MKFWDSSAIIPLCLKEPTSDIVKSLAEEDGDLVVWWTTRVECISGMARGRRERVLAIHGERQARAALSALAGEWSEIQPTEHVRVRAERLLMVHSLRAADALQLAAGLIWTEEATAGAVCVSRSKFAGGSHERRLHCSSSNLKSLRKRLDEVRGAPESNLVFHGSRSLFRDKFRWELWGQGSGSTFLFLSLRRRNLLFRMNRIFLPVSHALTS